MLRGKNKMFEEEATKYATVGWDKSQDPKNVFIPRIDETKFNDWRNGAQFAYNKVNEWHFTNRNEYHQVIDYPKGEENKLYLLLLNSRDSKEYEFGRKVPVVCYWNEEWCRFERLEHTIGERNVNKNDINAWKEIILPELKESK